MERPLQRNDLDTVYVNYWHMLTLTFIYPELRAEIDYKEIYPCSLHIIDCPDCLLRDICTFLIRAYGLLPCGSRPISAERNGSQHDTR